ncbi:MAG TPA: tetratricopeptide repeat protein, partial [Candidatus Ozemobacteraceae bacterium]|nr:tetratricopeptide repeat protein [Candidatus Ozemobacteraceae bacterium]
LGRIYEERLNDYPRAAEMYGKIVQNHPTFLSIDKVVYGLANCQEKTGNVEDAVKWYQEIVVKYPYSSFFKTAQSRMKSLAAGTQHAKGALEAQEGVIENARTDAQAAKATMDLAAMLTSQGEYKKAVEEYRKIANDPSNPELARQAYTRMASLLDEKEKDYKGAAAVLEEMVSKFPNEQGTDKSLYKLGRIHEENLQTLRTREQGDGSTLYKKSNENVRKAIEYYDRLTESFPDADVSADAYLRKGELYEGRIKDSDEALRQYKEYLRRFPDHDQAETIRKKVKKLESGESDDE